MKDNKGTFGGNDNVTHFISTTSTVPATNIILDDYESVLDAARDAARDAAKTSVKDASVGGFTGSADASVGGFTGSATWRIPNPTPTEYTTNPATYETFSTRIASPTTASPTPTSPPTASTTTSPATTAFARISTALASLYAAKNAAYGNSFDSSVRRYGAIAALTRLSDKFNRAENLILYGESVNRVADEKLIDTLLDLASYSIMTVMALYDDKAISATLDKVTCKVK